MISNHFLSFVFKAIKLFSVYLCRARKYMFLLLMKYIVWKIMAPKKNKSYTFYNLRQFWVTLKMYMFLYRYKFHLFCRLQWWSNSISLQRYRLLIVPFPAWKIVLFHEFWWKKSHNYTQNLSWKLTYMGNLFSIRVLQLFNIRSCTLSVFAKITGFIVLFEIFQAGKWSSLQYHILFYSRMKLN